MIHTATNRRAARSGHIIPRVFRGPGCRGHSVLYHVLVALLVASLLLPRPAHAIFGIGDVVYDPANHANAILRYGQLILQAQQMGRQVMVATQQANHALRQARGFSIGRLRIPSVGTMLDRIDARYGSGEALGYGNSELDRAFRETFPQVAEWNRRAAGQQAVAAREAAFNVLLSARDHALQMDRSRQRLDELKLQLISASTEREVAQTQAMIAAEQLDQELMQRHMALGAANLQAVEVALRADEAARAAMQDTAGAVYAAYQQSVHDAAERRVRVRQDSIARARDGRRRGPER